MTEAVEGAADEAVTEGTAAVEETTEEAVTEEAAAVEEAVEEAITEEAATEEAATEDATQEAATDEASDPLSVAGFDLETVSTMIDENVSNPVLSTTLKQGVQAAANNPDALGTALEAVKAAIGQ